MRKPLPWVLKSVTVHMPASTDVASWKLLKNSSWKLFIWELYKNLPFKGSFRIQEHLLDCSTTAGMQGEHKLSRASYCEAASTHWELQQWPDYLIPGPLNTVHSYSWHSMAAVRLTVEQSGSVIPLSEMLFCWLYAHTKFLVLYV